MTAVAPGRAHKASLLFASVAIVLVAITGTAAFTSLPKGTAPSSFVGVKSTTTEPTAGLVLGLALNQTTISPGQTVAIRVYERNILQRTNNVSASDKWPVNGLSAGPCGSLDLPVGIALYRGNLSVLAVPGVQPLQLYKPGPYYCPAIMGGIRAYVFQPMSGEAQVIGPCSPNPCFTSNMSSTIDVRGCWGTGLIQFSDFAPGIYTVVAGDEWGDVALLEFQVTSSNFSTSSSSETCTPAITLTQTSAGTTTTQVITLCHSISTYTASNNSAPTCSVPYAGIDSSSGNYSGVQSFPIVSIPAGQVGAICVGCLALTARFSITSPPLQKRRDRGRWG